ncbi:hypothetical protein PVT67_04625 [Gallaecimonas kandeliae]|uniref:hypothetical protein n=1 Tax=Gallaecimonas kandeliae TaxID=3029055 RepID=UPI002648C60D|nr:hypothetical protein [Gallaecimonas kandeliae]WKE66539.1 hypothetical protein PVT67_04625 [Gallaecimonas kandeliae]
MNPLSPLGTSETQRQPSPPISRGQAQVALSKAQGAAQSQGAAPSQAIGLKVQRHGQWALMSEAQGKLSRLQATEQSLVQNYRQLLALARQLEQPAAGQGSAQAKGQQLAAQVRSLRDDIAREGRLDSTLAPRARAGDTTALLTRVDLLGPRPQAENIQIQLPNGASLSLRLAAQASQGRALAELAPQLARQGITASLDSQGRLQLTGRPALLQNPWSFQGQGVRVPAGNPVPIRLDPQPDSLEQLAQGLDAGGLDAERSRLRALLAALEQHRRALQAERQQLMGRLAALRAEVQAFGQSPEELGQSLKASLRDSDFSLQLGALLTQANVSRQTVVSLLSR